MPGVSPEQIKQAREVDLLSYLRAVDPHELRRAGPNEYRTASHESLVISNGLWYWNRGQVGGRSALDYLVKVCGLALTEAAAAVLGSGAVPVFPLPVEKKEKAKRALSLPPPARFANLAVAYLQRRGISPGIIGKCLRDGILYESLYKSEPVCVFVGKDEKGQPRYATLRGVDASLKRDCVGSDKRYGFNIQGKNLESESLAVFESPIDVLSHASLEPSFEGARLSLGGTADVALTAFLERDPNITHISLCLDNDSAGQEAARKISSMLSERYPHITVTVDPPIHGKDYNDLLLYTKARQKERDSTGPHKEAGVSL
ncbi:MAG: DUF3991 and toprim domain-containing protein [Firmicutes bacterium]|nr:DUF3991 and toprim domain-containing protein [Bacillota bacterium]